MKLITGDKINYHPMYNQIIVEDSRKTQYYSKNQTFMFFIFCLLLFNEIKLLFDFSYIDY